MRIRLGLVLAMAVLLAGFPLQASALVTQPGPCSGGYLLPAAPFEDVAPDSPHLGDIACISGWGITVNQGRFHPEDAVTRWQMALFLTRTYNTLWWLPGGEPQGFADITGLPPDQQTAINQLRELSITSGSGPATYDPDGVVTRWQMALFLTRLVHAAAFPLPPGTDQGFTDLAGLSPEAQLAINQLGALGISTGTSPTTFSPHDLVTREQMASFLARTLGAVWHFDPLLEADEIQCDEDGNCNGAGRYWASAPFAVKAAWQFDLPFASPEEQESFESPDTRVELRLDGVEVPVTQTTIVLDGLAIVDFEAAFPTGLTGVHTLTYVFYDRGEAVGTHNFSFDFSL